MINKYYYVLIFLLFNYAYSDAMAEGDAFFVEKKETPLIKYVSDKRKIKREKKIKKNGDMLAKKHPQFYRTRGSMGIFTIVECIGRAKL